MTTESAAVETTAAPPAGLKRGAVGIVAVIFMAVANAAPITAMTGNVPIAVGFGNGLGTPAGFLFATVALTLFALGYVAMAKHITTGPVIANVSNRWKSVFMILLETSITSSGCWN